MAPAGRRAYSTDGVADGEQFAFWRESICEAFAALDPIAEAERVRPFPSRVEVDPFGSASVSLVQSQPQRVVRATPQIRCDPRERLFVNVMLSGRGRVEQGDARTLVAAGELYVVDTTRPYVLDHPEPFALLCLSLPRDGLLAPRRPALALAQARAADRGRAALAVGLLRQLREGVDVLGDDDRDEALAVVCRWLGSVLADAGPPRAMRAAAAVTTAVASDAGRVHVWRRAIVEIEARLRDPALGPRSLADSLGVSPRYLHQAFADQGATVAGTVRKLRLERCAQELRRAGGRRTIEAIAQLWGFTDVPNFHRLFRRRFGCTPGEHRG